MKLWIGATLLGAVALGVAAEPVAARSVATVRAEPSTGRAEPSTGRAEPSTRPAEPAVSAIPVPTAVASGVALLGLVALRRVHRDLTSD